MECKNFKARYLQTAQNLDKTLNSKMARRQGLTTLVNI